MVVLGFVAALATKELLRAYHPLSPSAWARRLDVAIVMLGLAATLVLTNRALSLLPA
ncbi:MAG: hypothetical protein ACRD0U_16880 [Acidimicrobiales bacterium]